MADTNLQTGNLTVAVFDEPNAQLYAVALQVLVDDFESFSGGYTHLQGNLNRNNPLQGSLAVEVQATGTGLQSGPYLPDK